MDSTCLKNLCVHEISVGLNLFESLLNRAIFNHCSIVLYEEQDPEKFAIEVAALAKKHADTVTIYKTLEGKPLFASDLHVNPYKVQVMASVATADFEPAYWNNSGKHQKDYNELYEKLVPDSGKAKTMYGELLRCVSRLYYDLYNNGYCNGPKMYEVNFIENHLDDLKGDKKNFKYALDKLKIKPENGSNFRDDEDEDEGDEDSGEMNHLDDLDLQIYLDELVDAIVEYVKEQDSAAPEAKADSTEAAYDAIKAIDALKAKGFMVISGGTGGELNIYVAKSAQEFSNDIYVCIILENGEYVDIVNSGNFKEMNPTEYKQIEDVFKSAESSLASKDMSDLRQLDYVRKPGGAKEVINSDKSISWDELEGYDLPKFTQEEVFGGNEWMGAASDFDSGFENPGMFVMKIPSGEDLLVYTSGYDYVRYALKIVDDSATGVKMESLAAATMPADKKLETIKKIVEEGQYAKIEGQIVDGTTANMLLQVIEALNEQNKQKFLSMPILKMVSVGWKCCNNSTAATAEDMNAVFEEACKEADACDMATADKFGGVLNLIDGGVDPMEALEKEFGSDWNKLEHLYDELADKHPEIAQKYAESATYKFDPAKGKTIYDGGKHGYVVYYGEIGNKNLVWDLDGGEGYLSSKLGSPARATEMSDYEYCSNMVDVLDNLDMADLIEPMESAVNDHMSELDNAEACNKAMSSVEEILGKDDKFKYQLLSRMQSDCEYYLRITHNNHHLWAGTPEEQIEYMKAIWNNLSEKPEWLSMEQIEDFEKKMLEKQTEMLEKKKTQALHPHEKGGQELKLQKIKEKHIDQIAKHASTGIVKHVILDPELSDLNPEQVLSVRKALVEVGNRNMGHDRKKGEDDHGKGSVGSDIAEWASWITSDTMGKLADYLSDSIGDRNAKDTYLFAKDKMETALLDFYRNEMNKSNYPEIYDFWSDLVYTKKAIGYTEEDDFSTFYFKEPLTDEQMKKLADDIATKFKTETAVVDDSALSVYHMNVNGIADVAKYIGQNKIIEIA